MRKSSLVFGTLLVLGCGASLPTITEGEREAYTREIEIVLDAWHAAASQSDEDAYFDLMAPDAVFLGTDESERWDRPAFRAYAHPYFAAGHGWSFRSVRRAITISRDGRLAFFDEALRTERLGPARGSGVLRRESDGRWRLVQYSLAITVPNARFSEVRRLLEADPTAGEGTERTSAVEATPENQRALEALERYRAAVVARDAETICTLLSPRFHTDRGTPDESDDQDAESFCASTTVTLSGVTEVSYEVTPTSIERADGLVHIDAGIQGHFQLEGGRRELHESVRFTFEEDTMLLRSL